MRSSAPVIGADTALIGLTIDIPAGEVYEFAANPANLPQWALGLGTSIAMENGLWVADSPMGRIVIEFAERNTLGVLDHTVTTPDGARFYNPVRVTECGSGSEIVFMLRRSAGVTDESFRADQATVLADLQRLKAIVEG